MAQTLKHPHSIPQLELSSIVLLTVPDLLKITGADNITYGHGQRAQNRYTWKELVLLFFCLI